MKQLQRFNIRALTLIGLATGAMVLSATARAQTYDPRYPVCLRAYGGQGGYTDCSYVSLTQCNATASGRGAECVINPFFSHPYERRLGRRSVR